MAVLGAEQLPNYEVKFTAANATAAANSLIKNITFNAGPNNATNGLPVVLFDSTDAANSFEFVNPPTITDQTGNGGIFAYNGGNYMGGLPFDLTPLNDGKIFFSSVTGGTFWGVFKPGSDHTVRLTGYSSTFTGGGTLAIGQTGAIADVGGANLILPDPMRLVFASRWPRWRTGNHVDPERHAATGLDRRPATDGRQPAGDHRHHIRNGDDQCGV